MFKLSRFPSLKIVLPIILGIILGVSFRATIASATIIALCALLILGLGIVSFLIFKQKHTAVITTLLISVAIIYTSVYCNYLAQTTFVQPQPAYKYYYSGIINELSASDKSLKINLKHVTLLLNNAQKEELNQEVVVYLKDYANVLFLPNDTLCFYTTLASTQINTNPFGSNLSNYYRYHGVAFTAFASPNDIVYQGKNNDFSLNKLAYQINQKLFALLQLHLTNNELAITTAMLLGNDNFITNDTLNDYKTTGLMHILSVSGMHVALIYGGLMWLLALFNINTKRTIWVNVMSLILVWSYIFIIGSPIAAVRSAFMISFLIVARISRNESNTLNALVASATLLLMYNPLSLMDIGFQLSYVAILGIVVLNPLIKKLYSPRNKPLYYVWELVTVSVSAQLFTTPLLLLYSHTFSNYFLVSNILCIGLSEIIMYCAIVVLVLSPVPVLGFASSYVLSLAIRLMNWVTAAIAQLPYAVSHVYAINNYTVALCYLTLALLLALIITRNKQYFIYTQLSVCVLLLYQAWFYYSVTHQHTIIIYAHKNSLGVYVTNCHNAQLYYTHSLDGKTLQQITTYNAQHYITNFTTTAIVSLPNYKLKNVRINNTLSINNTKYAAPKEAQQLWFNNKYYTSQLHRNHLVANGFWEQSLE